MSQGGASRGSGLTGGSLLARNAYINLVGQIVPILVAILAIPLLIKVLGSERFGVLALAWVVMGYFGLFDFGLGRATTKFVSEHYARDDTESLPELIWSSVLVNVVLGLIGGVILAAITPWLTQDALNIPDALLGETRVSFYLLAISVPLIVATAALRGVLEAIQRFDLVNLIKVPASVLSYLGPLMILYFFRGLVPVVAFLMLSRAVVLLAHLLLCLRALPILRHGFAINLSRMKPLVFFGGWLTVSGFIGPSIVAIDRFIIGSFISLSAVTLYVTPYEAVTKLTIFSTSLLSVLFPAFSAMAITQSHELRSLCDRAFKYLLVMVAPIVGVIIALAYELMSLWVAPEFALRSAPVAQWLAVGVLINVLSTIPLTALQGIGRADVVAKLQISQLPFYAILVWSLVGSAGISGIAMAWTIRMAVVGTALFVAADRLLPPSLGESGERTSLTADLTIVGVFLCICLGVGLLSFESVVVKVTLVFVLLAIFVLWEWFLLLRATDRQAFMKVSKPFFDKPKKGM